jgi:hypothetical protein
VHVRVINFTSLNAEQIEYKFLNIYYYMKIHSTFYLARNKKKGKLYDDVFVNARTSWLVLSNLNFKQKWSSAVSHKVIWMHYSS